MMTAKRVGLFLGLLFLSGCYEKTVEGSQTIYKFESWIAPTEIVVFSLVVLISYFLRRRLRYLSYLGIGLGLFFLFILPGSALQDRVIVDDQHFDATYGFWFYPSHHNIQYKDLEEVHYTFTLKRQNLRHYEMRITRKSGEKEVVPVGDLMLEAAQDILDRAQAQGVRVLDHFVHGFENDPSKVKMPYAKE